MEYPSSTFIHILLRKAVQQIVTNLMISHVELRSEDSPDIKPYVYGRDIEKIVVPLGEELNNTRQLFINVNLPLNFSSTIDECKVLRSHQLVTYSFIHKLSNINLFITENQREWMLLMY